LYASLHNKVLSSRLDAISVDFYDEENKDGAAGPGR
jgi:hypothetical protein